jgi:glutathione S-transferase
MKLYAVNPQNSLIACCRVTSMLTKQKVQYVTVDDAFRNSEEYKKLTTTDKFPLLQTSEGGLHETTAICKYFCALADNQFLGANAVQRSQVDQWISFNNTTLTPSLFKVFTGIFGWGAITSTEYKEAESNLKK